MFKHISIVLFVAMSLSAAPAMATEDPEIGQAIVAERQRIAMLDTTGADSVQGDCAQGDKHFMVVARIKRGTPGRFVQVGQSLARIKLASGEVVRARGMTDDAKRRLVFVLSQNMPSGVAVLDDSARRYVITARNDPRGVVMVGKLRKMCLVHESAA